jgi:hypothetical protein
MPSAVSQTPFVIQPDPGFLAMRPDLRRHARDLARAYAGKRFASEEALQALGGALWHALDVNEDFAAARKRAANQILPVVVDSDVASIQQLPWEVLYHPDHGFLGSSPFGAAASP